MRDGNIEQVGAPDEVFHRPATRFVAGFIGSPSMNLVEAEIADDQIVFANGDRLPAPTAFKHSASQGRKVIFGLRPDDLYPTGHGLPSDHAGAVHEQSLKVNLTEPLGNETLVFFDFAGREWVSRMLNPRPLATGGSISVSFDLANAHLFDAADGVALARMGG
jgi:multiple sugar transport system ATP-binding protein